MSTEQDADEERLIASLSVFAKRTEPQMPTEKANKSLRDRRARETRPISANTRRRLRSTAETKSVQLNLKVTPTFKAQVSAMATARRVSVTELIEQAVGALAQ